MQQTIGVGLLHLGQRYAGPAGDDLGDLFGGDSLGLAAGLIFPLFFGGVEFRAFLLLLVADLGGFFLFLTHDSGFFFRS